jgi:invasion protein IalB
VLSLSIAYVPSLDRHALQVTVPLEISIPKGLTIQTDSYTSPVLKYRRCDRNGCYVEMAVDNGLIESLGKSGPAGKINIVADSGKSYALNFSLKGFAQAHDDMASQARAKAKAVAKPADAAPAAPAPSP